MILQEIIQQKKEDVAQAKKQFPPEWLGRSLAYNPYVPRDFKNALDNIKDCTYNIIAEIKKASPSKGVIRKDFDPLFIAQEYEKGGAIALSVLTEEHFFLGKLEYLSLLKRFVRIPILRKDFIIDSYQIIESAVYGADSLLLIAAVLSQKNLNEFIALARRFGIEPLVEIHSKSELLKAISAGANIIGINHRNLEDFSMDMNLCKTLVPLIPRGKTVVAESGLHTQEQLQELSALGIDAFLIGEFFMRHEDVKKTLETLNKKKV